MVHGKKETKRKWRIIIIIHVIIIRNGAKTISLQTLFGRHTINKSTCECGRGAGHTFKLKLNKIG